MGETALAGDEGWRARVGALTGRVGHGPIVVAVRAAGRRAADPAPPPGSDARGSTVDSRA